MKSDVVVIGAELEAFISALRLADGGAKVRLLMPGGGSLHYWNGGLGILETVSGNKGHDHRPFDRVGDLHPFHPYRLIGAQQVKDATDWFLEWLRGRGEDWKCSARNADVLTTAGLSAPAYAYPSSLATFDALPSSVAALVAFDDHLDFLPELCASGMAARAFSVAVVRAKPPVSGDSVRIAHAFDECAVSYFNDLRPLLPKEAAVALFPAVLGLERHGSVVTIAEQVLGVRVFEIATLPPSVLGLRLYRLMIRALGLSGVALHPDVRGLRANIRNNACEGLVDQRGQAYVANTYVVATGGVMMGGLEVDSRGIIREPVFGLDTHQTEPLQATHPQEAMEALHRAGVAADESLRPTIGNQLVRNVHATGALLAHWNPVCESSNEGVAIATGYAAADFALGRFAA